MRCLKGKALLIIERTDSEYVPFDVNAIILTGHSLEGKDAARDDFDLLSTKSLPLPNAAYKLRVGDKIWVNVVYEFFYHQDYFGEWDVDLTYNKQRVIKRKLHRK
jgi:hypothetical protein